MAFKKLSKTQREILFHRDLFEDFTEEEFDTTIQHCKRLTFRKDAKVYQENDIGNGLYIILEGEARIYLPKSKTRRQDIELNLLKSGDIFGEYSLIDEQKISANVTARKALVLAQIRTIDFDLLVIDEPAIGSKLYKNLLRLLINRLRKKDKELDILFRK